VGEERKLRNVPFGANKWEERLRYLFDGLVEHLRRRMAILMEDLVLGEEHALCEKTEEMSIKKNWENRRQETEICSV
jgi:hypothetical protein